MTTVHPATSIPTPSSTTTSNESWASWILSSYATSISPPEPESYLPTPDPATAADATSFPFGPYAKTGRGGAGNFTWQSDASADFEAHRHHHHHQLCPHELQKAAAINEAVETHDALRSKIAGVSHINIGRGGAGNYTSPSDINLSVSTASTGIRSSSAPSSTSPTKLSPHKPSSPRFGAFPTFPTDPDILPSTTTKLRATPRYAGRGGAGNFKSTNAEAAERSRREKEEMERRVAQDLKEQAARNVEMMLRRPQGALLAEGRRRSFGSDAPAVF